jgi:hypothetical protein
LASGDVQREFVDDESWNRDAAHLIGLRGAEHGAAADLRDRLDDLGAATHQVESPHAECGHLAA